ncbi:MAG: hypothetical protein K9G31_03240 [Crocinitomicaceae bacterium]|nr:hypothetical protein [Crocinitomicaceae bacterium]MCF8445168.1 hypothetical protein [Crocinitomicaceae bacterium]
METPTIKINKKIRKYEEKSDAIFHDINEFLDVSNKVKKNIETLIKLGEAINEIAFTQVGFIHSCSSNVEKDFKAVAGLMTILVGKSKAYHNLFADHGFYKESLKSTLEKFSVVISEMEEAAQDIFSTIDLKHDQEWNQINEDLDRSLELL